MWRVSGLWAQSLSVWVSVSVGCGAVGCEPPPRWGQGYSDQLTEAFGARPSSAPRLPKAIAELPLLRDRAVERPSTETIKTGVMIGLSSCEVSRWIAYRNSPLGRVMLPSQRLLYEARFLTLAPACEPSPELSLALQAVTQKKREAWRINLYELTWRGRALSTFFSVKWRSDRPPPEPSAQDLAALRWLGSLASWADSLAQRTLSERRAELKTLEDRLERELASLSPHAGGRVMREAYESHEELSAWVELLSEPKRATPCALVKALFTSYQALQPELSARVRRLERLTEAVAGLTSLTSLPTAMSPLLTLGLSRGPEGLLAGLKRLSSAHALALKPHLERCHLLTAQPAEPAEPAPSSPGSTPSSSSSSAPSSSASP